MVAAQVGRFSNIVLFAATLVALSGCAQYAETEFRDPHRPARPAAAELDRGGEVFSSPVYDDPRVPAAVAEDDARAGAARRSERRPRIFSGESIASSLDRSGARAQLAEGDVTLNFTDTDVAEASRLIIGDILQRNLVISPNVKGRLTFQTSRPLAKEAVLGVFDSVLGTIDATLIDRGAMVEILPLAEARGTAAPLSTPGQGAPGFRVEVVPLRFVSAAEMRRILDPIGGQGSVLGVDEARNVIMLAGSSRTIAPLKETISLFDQNWAAKQSLGLVPLENVSADVAVDEMQKIFGGGDRPGLAVRYVPIKRMNAVVLIAPDVKLVEEMIAWLEELDRGSIGGDDRIYVYFAQNTRATDLADSMQAVLTGRSTSRSSESDFGRPASLRGDDRPIPASATADDAAEAAAASRFSGRAGSGVAFGGLEAAKVQVVAEEQRNALLVSASPSDWRKIQSILRRLDVPPLQVMLEATIVEVTLNDTLRYGLQWFFNRGNNNFTLSDVASGAVNATFPGFSYVFSTNDIRVALDALTDVTDVEIVSAPSLMVLNNETATLQVGDQVPIAVQSAVSVNDPDSPIVNTIQFRDTGVILKVTPRVNNSGLVIAEIEQEVSTVSATESSGIDSPTISQRRLASTIAVSDGEAIALGGLIQDTRSLGKNGVPLLSEVPVLGALFRSSSNQATRTELLLIITPRVVRDASEARAVTRELRNRLTPTGPR